MAILISSIEVFIGVLSVIGVILLSKRLRSDHWAYALSLIILPIPYLVFALFAENDQALALEFVYGLPFFAAGLLCLFIGFRGSAWVVACLWLIHAPYDVFHDQLFINDGVLGWYPLVCLGFDVAMGLYLILLANRLPSANLKLRPVKP